MASRRKPDLRDLTAEERAFVRGGRTKRRDEPEPVEEQVVLSTRVRRSTKDAFDRVLLERRIARTRPWTVTDALDEAMREWTERSTP